MKINEISEEILMATFAGMGRNEDDLVYFDKEEMDILAYVNGFLSSLIKDNIQENQILAERIIAEDKPDYIDPNRYILIDRIFLNEFLEEYKIQTKGKEPFYSFVEIFQIEIFKEFSDFSTKNLIENLAFNNFVQEKFHQIFSEIYYSKFNNLSKDYTQIFESTCDKISKNWIINNTDKPKNMTEKFLCDQIAETLKSQIENEFDTKVFSCGFYDKNTPEFRELQPAGTVPPENAEHLFYFLIPFDDEDNVVFNNYYQLYRATQGGLMFSPANRRAAQTFRENLRQDNHLTNFISKAIENQVHPTGSKKISNYSSSDNIIKDAEKIEDLRYRYFRFYLPKMT